MSAATIAPAPGGALARTERATGGWRVAARLARREVRRRWGRTALVMLLVAVPVFGMTMITVLVRTTAGQPGRQFARANGNADLIAEGTAPTPTGGWPAGTEITRGRGVDSIGLVAGTTARLADATDIDLDNPVVHGSVLLRAGRFPRTAGEALITPKLAAAFHVGVGDTLRLTEPAWTERIVGIGVKARDWNDGLIAVRGNELSRWQSALGPDRVLDFTFVRLPGHPSASELRSYGPAYSSARSHSGGVAAVNWTLVAGAIALAIIGVVISGAFAVGARRQLVTLGQLSANGADESLLRRSLSLQGAWCGALGAALGMAAAVATLLLTHARFDTLIAHDIGPYVWLPRDLIAIAATGVVTATIAAFVPARTAARVPVLSALAGRRPLGALPRTMVPIGGALFGGGVVILMLVAAASRNGGGNGLAFAAVLGGLLVLSGACCVTPVVVATLARFGRFVRGSGRVAVRSIVRSRARSAAVVMALVAINAGAIAMSTALASGTETKGVAAPFMPDNTLVVQQINAPVDGPPSFVPVSPAVLRTLHTVLPSAHWDTERAVEGVTTVDNQFQGKGPGGIARRVDTAIVADPGVTRMVGLSHADAATLQHDGVLALPAPFDATRPRATRVDLTIDGPQPHQLTATVARGNLRAVAGIDFLITAAKAHELGLVPVDAGAIATNPSAFDESQRASIEALSTSVAFDQGSSPSSTAILWSGNNSKDVSANVVKQIILGIVILIALIVLATSLALSAAETRDERDVLVALGARPGTMRGLAAWKAGLLSFTGAAVAVPTGFIPVALVYLAAVRPDERARLGVPWMTIAELVLAAPLIAAFVAAVGSSVAQRLRPTQMSTFATD